MQRKINKYDVYHYEHLVLTCSNTLQLRSHPAELAVKPKILMANFWRLRAELPYKFHHSTVKSVM